MASGHISVAQGRDFLLAYMEIARGIASEEMDFFFFIILILLGKNITGESFEILCC